MVQIYFDTSTFDEIERDVKVLFINVNQCYRVLCHNNLLYDLLMFLDQVTLESALGLIGGTMGLLTGFSILSGVEIIYFVFRFFLSDLLTLLCHCYSKLVFKVCQIANWLFLLKPKSNCLFSDSSCH